MIKLTREVDAEFTYTVDYYVRKEAIIGVFEIRKKARIELVSGKVVEVKESASKVLELLK